MEILPTDKIKKEPADKEPNQIQTQLTNSQIQNQLSNSQPLQHNQAIQAVKEECSSDVMLSCIEYNKATDLTHTEMMCLLQQRLAQLIKNDCLLADLPPEVTVEEVNSQIALEYGQAIRVRIQRADGVVMSVVVIQDGTVQDLKKAIQRHVMLNLSRRGGQSYISWHYIWKGYWLMFEGVKLIEDNKLIKQYGIKTHSEIIFIKRLKNK